ncbi:MAG: hypothetical protein P1Q69_13925 [Candidatus Thorarchaeota archaeon]|nr:hypothetical protein [Candidatus Thorarchaeota archaeon]
MQNRTSFILVLIGGIILLIEGITGSIGFFAYLELIETIPELVLFVPIVNALVWLLTILAFTSGFGTIGGGYLLTTKRVGTGKFIIGLSVGMGLIGLIIKLAQLIWFSGATAVLDFFVIAAQSLGWVGIFLTIAGRQSAKKPDEV